MKQSSPSPSCVCTLRGGVQQPRFIHCYYIKIIIIIIIINNDTLATLRIDPDAN